MYFVFRKTTFVASGILTLNSFIEQTLQQFNVLTKPVITSIGLAGGFTVQCPLAVDFCRIHLVLKLQNAPGFL